MISRKLSVPLDFLLLFPLSLHGELAHTNENRNTARMLPLRSSSLRLCGLLFLPLFVLVHSGAQRRIFDIFHSIKVAVREQKLTHVAHVASLSTERVNGR